MAGTTARGLHRPIGSDPYEPATALTRLTDPTDEGILADTIEARMVSCAPTTEASRPTAGIARRLHYATDTGDWSYDTGAAWVQQFSTARAVYAAGTARTLSNVTPHTLSLGAETDASVSGLFTKVAHDTSGHAVQVAFDGIYRASAVVTATGDASNVTGGIGAASFLPSSGLAVASCTMVLRLTAGSAVMMQGLGTAGAAWTQTCLALVVERIAP